MQLSLRYFMEYTGKGLQVDFSRPFPSYIHRLLKLQIPATNSERLKSDFRVTPARLSARVDQLFKVQKGTATAALVADKISGETLGALMHVISFIHSTPAFTQRDLLADLTGVLRQNRIPFDETVLRAAGDKITLYSMLLLHGTSFDIGAHENATCLISGGIIARAQGVDFNPNLQVSGLVKIRRDAADDLEALTWVMTTDLPMALWCEPRLFVQVDGATPSPPRLSLENRAMVLSPAFKLDTLTK